jgi:crotonobetainyl-CoA:carnitine CoA-transferase CaiB-like acyl-CoA transferase
MGRRAPLDGVRVADFTWVVAGPVATRILADQGAEVIKIERRLSESDALGPRRTGLQGDINRSKLSVAINMATPQGVELARRLVAKSDVVIDNFSARVMRQWGMDYASLVKIKPDIICISMSGFGHTGPRTNYVSYGPTLQALAGFTLLMANRRGEPAGYGYSYADMAAGYTGALAVLFALWHRDKTGRGQFIDLSQFESLVAVIGPALLDISANGRRQIPPGVRSQEGPAAPRGIYRCRALSGDEDRWLAISVRTHAEWEGLIRALGYPAWATQPKFATLFMRMRNGDELDAHVEQWTLQHDAAEAMELLQRQGVPAGIVANGADLCARNPQLNARGFWMQFALPDGTGHRTTGTPIKLSDSPVSPARCAPEPGDDNSYVLGEVLGLTRSEREALVSAGAIWP